MKTGDTWGREYQQNVTDSGGLISVGNWRPSDGPSMSDELFPHIVHGFRRRNLPLVTFHVFFKFCGNPVKLDCDFRKIPIKLVYWISL